MPAPDPYRDRAFAMKEDRAFSRNDAALWAPHPPDNWVIDDFAPQPSPLIHSLTRSTTRRD